MPTADPSDDRAFIDEVEAQLGRRLTPDEARLAASLQSDKTAAIVARELQGGVIADPKKIRPEHSDVEVAKE